MGRSLWVVMGNFAYTDDRTDFCESRPLFVYATEEEARREARRITDEYVAPNPCPQGWEKEPSMGWVAEIEDRIIDTLGPLTAEAVEALKRTAE